VLGPFLHAGCASAAWVHGGSLVNDMGAGRRWLTPRVGGVRWSGPLAAVRAREDGVRAGVWGVGQRCVFPQCGVGHAWTLGLVLRLVALSGLLRQSPSEACHGYCVENGYSTERFLTMRTLRVVRS